MRKGILTEDIVNNVLDRDVVLARRGAEVTILEDLGDHYEVAYYNGSAPSSTFYVHSWQMRLLNE